MSAKLTPYNFTFFTTNTETIKSTEISTYLPAYKITFSSTNIPTIITTFHTTFQVS
jgi:hypothetical protein